MTVTEVEKLVHSELTHDPRVFGTHVFRDQDTDVWLTFESRGLTAVQTATLWGLMGMKMSPKTELCTEMPVRK